MDVQVRRIGPDEWEVLRHLRLAALADSPSAFGARLADEEALEEAAWRERARRSAAGADRATFLAVVGGTPAGLVGAHRLAGDAGVELTSMWTVPTARRAGTGRKMVEAVLAWADAGGARAVSLWVTRGNDPARHLYRSLGFTPDGDHRAPPSDPCRDELRMVRPLDVVAPGGTGA